MSAKKAKVLRKEARRELGRLARSEEGQGALVLQGEIQQAKILRAQTFEAAVHAAEQRHGVVLVPVARIDLVAVRPSPVGLDGKTPLSVPAFEKELSDLMEKFSCRLVPPPEAIGVEALDLLEAQKEGDSGSTGEG